MTIKISDTVTRGFGSFGEVVDLSSDGSMVRVRLGFEAGSCVTDGELVAWNTNEVEKIERGPVKPDDVIKDVEFYQNNLTIFEREAVLNAWGDRVDKEVNRTARTVLWEQIAERYAQYRLNKQINKHTVPTIDDIDVVFPANYIPKEMLEEAPIQATTTQIMNNPGFWPSLSPIQQAAVRVVADIHEEGESIFDVMAFEEQQVYARVVMRYDTEVREPAKKLREEMQGRLKKIGAAGAANPLFSMAELLQIRIFARGYIRGVQDFSDPKKWVEDQWVDMRLPTGRRADLQFSINDDSASEDYGKIEVFVYRCVLDKNGETESTDTSNCVQIKS